MAPCGRTALCVETQIQRKERKQKVVFIVSNNRLVPVTLHSSTLMF